MSRFVLRITAPTSSKYWVKYYAGPHEQFVNKLVDNIPDAMKFDTFTGASMVKYDLLWFAFRFNVIDILEIEE